ncbi:MAG: hypothetical protein K0Q79_1215 [Flavipsychrobacter sp.]|nr:hypothetical protein [Flavipsychrobacter sp.]
MSLNNGGVWQQSKTDIFWAEIAPCDHVVQIYENDNAFLDALAGFVGGGINSGDCVIVIATQAHLKALETRLSSYGIHVDDLISEDRYIPLDAEETLAKFMVDGWPNEDLFMRTVSELLARAQGKKRRVRAFGEMVALLWAEGNSSATVRLEHLWNKFCEQATFCLFCAYPKTGFTQDMNTSIMHICGAHSKMINGSKISLTDIEYRAIA